MARSKYEKRARCPICGNELPPENKMYCSRECYYKGNRKENHPLWAGEDIKYKSLHCWLNNNYEKPERCEMCREKKSLDWALIGEEYTRDINDYAALCRSCHFTMDAINSNRVELKCDYCGKKITRCRSRFENNDRHYCSRKCYYKHKKETCRGENNSNYRHGKYAK